MPKKENPDRLPPHSPEAEQGVLGCVLIQPDLLDKECKRLRGEHFYDLRHARLWDALRVMYQKREAIDEITVLTRLKKAKILEDCGGAEYVCGMQERTPSAGNASYYVDILVEKFALRKTLHVLTDAGNRIWNWEGGVGEYLQGVQAEVDTVSALLKSDDKPVLKVWRSSDLQKWAEPPHLRLIGDGEIRMGYEGMTIIAGPGSSGKSMLATSVALAGARGKGTWMGRPVHRQFRTLVIQAENGRSRMKKELATASQNHPDIDIENNIFVSEPPEGGLPFHRPAFRTEVRRQVEIIRPALVVLDTWAQAAADDSAKDVLDKLGEIRSCFPSGDECPGLLIIAHTKKPRPEDVRRGRALTNLISGSIALPNAARCAYALLPWTEELEEERVYFACCKLNDGEMYTATVWKRRFGTFFEHDPHTDPNTWGVEDTDDDKQVSEADIITAFGSESVLAKSTLAKRLVDKGVCGYSTAMRAIGKGGYRSHMVETTAEGWLQLRDTK